jgi:beta-lactamase family protein
MPVASFVVLATLSGYLFTVAHRRDDRVLVRLAAGTSTSMSDPVARIDQMDRSGPRAAEYGVAVLDRATGQLTLGQEGAVPFRSASVVKLLTVVDILHRTDTKAVTLTPAQQVLIRKALDASDDKAMDALWTAFGGPATVTEMVALAKLHDTTPPAVPGQWGETRLSARDVVAVYNYVFTSLTPASRNIVLTALANAKDTGADGFNQAFGLLHNPRPASVAAKQGWMMDGSHMYLHSTGMFGANHQYLVAVLSKQQASAGYDAGRQLMDAAVSQLTGALNITS